MEPDLRSRFRGALLGLAVGDALGATVEFMGREEIRARFGVHRELVGGGWLRLAPGEYTDDTQMALAIARSIVALGRIDPDDIARHFVAWYETAPKDIGKLTRRALGHLAAGVAWQDAGERARAESAGRSASNGSLMRTAPVALATWRDPEALVRQSLDVSRITHADPLCAWSCVAFDQALAATLAGTVDVLAAAADVPQVEVHARIAAIPQLGEAQLRSGGYVLDTLQSALWCTARHDDYEQAVVAAVNLGDDADTTGAVAGALAGARCGEQGIPARWLAVLQNRAEITALADGLWQLFGEPGNG